MAVTKYLRLSAGLLAFLCALLLPCLNAATAQRPQILIVLSYHVGMLWEDEVTRGIVERLGDDNDIIITQLDVQRYPVAGRETQMLEIMSNRVAISHPVLVITIDDYAYRYVLEHREVFAPGTPIVFGGINFWDEKVPPGITGVVEALDIPGTLQLMNALQPDAKRLVIVNDETDSGSANRKAVESAFARGGKREILWLGGGTFAETEAQLAKLDPRLDAVLLLTWNLDSAGDRQSYGRAILRARRTCPAPIYGVWEFYFGHGIVGGGLLDGRVHGHEVGDIAKRVLGGESSGSIPVVTQCRTTLKVDYNEVARFGFAPSSIPTGAEVHNRVLSAWEQYAGAIVTACLVILLQGATITWLVIVIQRRKQARAKLRESEANLRYTLDSIEEAVVVTDTRNVVVRVNPAAEKLAGLASAQLRGLGLHEVFPLQDLKTGEPLILPSLISLKQGRGKAQAPRAMLKSRTGSESVVVQSAAPILDDKGVEQGMVMVLRDITEQSRMEEHLQQAQKMESIGQLAGGIAHDFNNILAVIVGHAELLQDEVQDRPAAIEDVQMLLRGAQRATDLVQQILAFSRKEKHEMVPVVLQTVVKDALKFLRSTVPSSIEIAPRISVDLPLVLADITQIHQVIMNLCTNAVHAMKGAPTGRLEVRLEAIHADAEFATLHPGLREGEYVRLSVSDTGRGMDETTVKRIFEPFFTTKAQGEGTGLGLSVVHGIVKAHNGGVFVYSRPGEGSIFHIYLPALSIARNGVENPEVPVPAGHGEHVLLVDDEPSICASARRIIEKLGYRVTVFNSAAGVLDYLRRNGCGVDLLITDMTMPGGSGLMLAAEVQKQCPGIPIVLTTGFAAELDEGGLKAQGISRLVLKPFTTNSLGHALGAVIGRRTP